MDTRADIRRMQAEGLSLCAIARVLNRDRVPTPSGTGQWGHASVRQYGDPAKWNAYMRAYRATRR